MHDALNIYIGHPQAFMEQLHAFICDCLFLYVIGFIFFMMIIAAVSLFRKYRKQITLPKLMNNLRNCKLSFRLLKYI